MAERATFSKAVLFAQQGRLSEARRAIAAGAASVGPIAAAIFRARLLLAAGAWEDVARTELPILRSVHGPSRAEALATCAIAEERLGRLHEARATLMTAITCGGGARHEKSLGALLQRGGNLEAALRAFEASAAHEPRPAERVDAALSAARTAAAAEAWDQAGDWAERAVDVAGPRDAETATAAAQILAAADRWDRAREILGAAAAHHPNHPEIEAIFVRWDLWRGDAEGARARAARGALRAEDRDLALAIAAILRSDPEAALALADRVVAMSPASAEARIVRAEAHLLLGSFEAARADAHEAQAHARGYTFAAGCTIVFDNFCYPQRFK